MRKLFQKSEFRIACYILLLFGVFGTITGASWEQFMDKFSYAPKTASYRAYMGERAIGISYVGTSTYAMVFSTRAAGTANVNSDMYIFYDVNGTPDASVGTGGVIFATMTAYDTMGEFVAHIDGCADWEAELIDARSDENTKLLEGANTQLQADGVTALAHTDSYSTCVATNTYISVDANGTPTTVANGFTLYFDTGPYIGISATGGVINLDKSIRWAKTPASGKRIVITCIRTLCNYSSAGYLRIYFDGVLRTSIKVADNSAENWFATDTNTDEIWAPVGAEVQVRIDSDVNCATTDILNVNWFQF